MDDDGRLSIDGRMSRFSGSVRDFDEMSTHSGSSSLLSAQGNLVTKMASEKFADPEVLRTCPFDPVHVVQAYRYQRHILRCRQQNPEKARNHHQCKYNGMHWIHKDLMEDHLKDCPDRNRVSIKSRFQGLQRPSHTDSDKINFAEGNYDDDDNASKMIRPTREQILKLKEKLRADAEAENRPAFFKRRTFSSRKEY